MSKPNRPCGVVDPIEILNLLDNRVRLRGDPDRRAELARTQARLDEVLGHVSDELLDADDQPRD
jgi:hypothetical protein